MYSLLSASVLACDLARHPCGAAVADVVDRVLALSPYGPWIRVDPAPHAQRARVRSATPVRRFTGITAAEIEEGTALRTLAGSLLGDLEDLLGLLSREEPLRSAPAGVRQVALDAVTAAWAGRDADLDDLLALRRPWDALIDPVPPALPDRPWTAAVRDLLDEVPHRTDSQWARSAAAHRGGKPANRWSVAMHEACAAVAADGRVLEVARAQLAASRSLRLSRASTGVDPSAVAMVLTAAVQSVSAQDLLDTRALREAWDAGS
jgi:hypothetical protein